MSKDSKYSINVLSSGPKKQVNILTMADVHLAANTTKTEKIVAELVETFSTINLHEIDILFIAGDFFDRSVPFNSSDSVGIRYAITFILNICKKYNIALRVLNGTNSHDFGQSAHFVEQNINAKIGADVNYVDTLSIEIMDTFGISVLYLPDEYSHDASVTLRDVKAKLKEYGLEKADVMVMHGAFEFQMRGHESMSTHNSKEYNNLVNYCLLCGHVHKPNRLDRILIPGSFSRLRHGEEEEKGMLYVELHGNNVFKSKFILNKNTTKYITVTVTGMELDKAVDKLTNTIAKLPSNSYLKIKCASNDPIRQIEHELQNKYPNIKVSIETDNSLTTIVSSIFNDKVNFNPISLDKTNIFNIVSEKLKEVYPDEDNGLCIQLLSEVVGG